VAACLAFLFSFFLPVEEILVPSQIVRHGLDFVQSSNSEKKNQISMNCAWLAADVNGLRDVPTHSFCGHGFDGKGCAAQCKELGVLCGGIFLLSSEYYYYVLPQACIQDIWGCEKRHECNPWAHVPESHCAHSSTPDP
jgi:hypothetical protein